MRDSFVFYKSFYEAIAELPSENQLELYDAICRYSLFGEVPEMSGISKAMFTLMKPNIDATAKKYRSSVENGKKGGRPKKEPNENPAETQQKPNENPAETQSKADRNLNEDVDEDVDEDDEENDDLDKSSAESSEDATAETPENALAVFYLPLIDGTQYGVSSDDVVNWAVAYPAIDVMQELHKMYNWLDANPKNKKTSRGIKRFIVNWLSRSQDSARKPIQTKPQQKTGFDLDEFFNAACLDSEKKRIENPPKTAGNDESIRERAEQLKRQLS